jgi:hypothetical protein
VTFLLKAELPPFKFSKAENHFQKAEIDRSFVIKKQEKRQNFSAKSRQGGRFDQKDE